MDEKKVIVNAIRYKNYNDEFLENARYATYSVGKGNTEMYFIVDKGSHDIVYLDTYAGTIEDAYNRKFK